ncbi:MAG TPA: NADH-quinone oxidoreductase subunit H [Chitinispirillaceae bacterium]|nr:NADH-quinone oxidoreductase subunit H [Chitinispirillaceae bacterium]
MVTNVIHVLLLLLMPPLLLGIINKTKAWFGGRVGAPFLQPYYDILKLLRKGMVFSTTTTWIFRIGPIVTLVALLIAGLLVPMGRFDAPVYFTGDLILFAYLFGLSRFFTTAAALDTGSSFEGMGSAREVTFACFSEPALFFAFLVLVKISGSLSLTPMLHGPANGFSVAIAAPVVLIAIGLFVVMLAESCRIPVDDPNTHLELTMIHEVMVLDHSGPLFGVISYTAAVKLFVLSTVLLHIIMPFEFLQDWANWLIYIFGVMGVSVLIGIVESIMARLQMRHVPYLLISALLFCAFGFILLIR